jgi:septal ring factor EnvC (AmiA/AmiB activator)
MAIAPTTVTALEEIRTLRQAAGPQIRTALIAAIPAVANVATLAANIGSKYRLASVQEDDDVIEPKLTGAAKTAARVADHCREAEEKIRQIIQAVKQLGDQDAEIRALVTQLQEPAP